MADYTGGYSGAVNQLSEMQSRGILDQARQQQMAAQTMQMLRQQQLLGMRGPGIQALQGAMGPQVPQPPAPQPGAMSPGGGNPQVQPPAPPMGGSMMAPPGAGGGMPPPPVPQGPQAMAPTQALGAPPMQPFRPMPTTPPGGAPGAVPSPPGAQPQSQQPEQIVPPQHIDIKGVLGQMDKMGLNPEQKADALEGMMPMIQAAQNDELKFYHAQVQAQSAAINAYRAEMTSLYQKGMLANKGAETERKTKQGDANIDIKRQKESRLRSAAASGAGGAANLKTTELIYPKGEDGRPDETKAPIGVRGITKTGKIITLDADGKPTTLAGGTAKEAKDTKSSGQATVRANLVKSGVKNSLARLDEIEKLHPTGATSSFFGTHAENPATRAIYGAGQSMQSDDQQDIDAKWASFIDEAIPVFTGGLRGSDAFRRFLIEQAPGPGASKKTIAEKMRLFRANIQGTSKAFFGKFQSDPSMWAPGVTAEEVKGAGAAPQQGEPKKISGDAEYDALPSGAVFVGPDGVARTKP